MVGHPLVTYLAFACYFLFNDKANLYSLLFFLIVKYSTTYEGSAPVNGNAAGASSDRRTRHETMFPALVMYSTIEACPVQPSLTNF